MKTIYVLRHARAVTGTPDMQDFERPLTPMGKQNAAALATHLADRYRNIDTVLCSSAARAKETWEELSAHWSTVPPAQFYDKLYLASAGDLFHEVQQLDDAYQSVLLVGHNPGLHHFCLTAAADGDPAAMSDLEVLFPSCSFVTLEMNAPRWSAVEPNTGFAREFAHQHATADRLE